MNEKDSTGIPAQPPTRAKVAQIITASQIVLNMGSDHGVTVGLRYRIILPIEVKDPDNPENKLFTLEYSKGVVEVTQVFDKVSVAKPPSVVTWGHDSIFGGRSLVTPKLNVETVLLSDDALLIRIGDVARLEQPNKA